MPKAKKSKKNSSNSKAKNNFFKRYSLFLFGFGLIALSFYLNIFFKDITYIDDVQNNDEQNENIQLQPEEPKKPQIPTLTVSDSFTAKSYLVYDTQKQKIVGAKNQNTQVANASTTKLMTAFIAYKEMPLNKVLVVPETCINLEGSNVGLLANQQFTVEDLLYGVLLKSGADAVCTITENYPGGTEAFIKTMNEYSKNLGLKNTNYQNAIGFDDVNHYSTSYDLLRLIEEVKKHEKLKIIMGTRDYSLKNQVGGNFIYTSNTNELLFSLPGTIGYKTGTTNNAGECLVFGYDNFGTKLIIVVMGSSSRFDDTKELLGLYLTDLGIINNVLQIQSSPTISFTPN